MADPPDTHGGPKTQIGRDVNGGTARPSLSGMEGAAIPTPQPRIENDGGRQIAPVAGKHVWVLRLVEREGSGILRMLWRMLGREQDVMDAYQDCFCKLASRGGDRGVKNARAFAYRTAANVAIEIIRTRTRRASHWPRIVNQHAPDQNGASPSASEEDGLAVASDRIEILREVISQLPAHLRNVVVLRDLSRMTYEEVGRTLGIEPTTARVYRRHAVVKLTDLLTQGTE